MPGDRQQLSGVLSSADRLTAEHPHIREISLAWEAETGADSIDTIERTYYNTTGGAFVCCWPPCLFARRDAAKLWLHIHTAHGGEGLPHEGFDWGAHF